MIAAKFREHVKNATPLYFRVNFRGKCFREIGVNHENHENIVPQTFGAIRYVSRHFNLPTFSVQATPLKTGKVMRVL